MLPTFTATDVVEMKSWSSYHGNVKNQPVPFYCTPRSAQGQDPAFEMHGRSLREILTYCLDPAAPKKLRPVGGRWSLSSILRPETVAIDTANMNEWATVEDDFLTKTYRANRPGRRPVFIQAGAELRRIHDVLGAKGLALQTSGASDGQRLGGALATGTHGSAIGIGALHDTVLALHLVVAPDRSWFLQPADGACSDEAARWLEQRLGIPTTSVRNDELFAAALVSLGSLGVLHGAVIEAVPAYRLRQRTRGYAHDDQALWRAIETLDTLPLHPDVPERPYHFEVVFNPFRRRAYMECKWRSDANGVPFVPADPLKPDASNELISLLAKLADVFDDPAGGAIIEKVIGEQVAGRYVDRDVEPRFPGLVFGPTGTPPGRGSSTEIVVNHAHARAAIGAVLDALAKEAAAGRHAMGAIGVRFLPRTRALLGMNIHPTNCFIEIPGIGTKESHQVYAACWDALSKRQIAFGCHWGQGLGLNAAQIKAYYGDRLPRWKDARAKLVTDPAALKVFASPILAECGIDP
jgi:FAD/FMN-containing dehydrogenase